MRCQDESDPSRQKAEWLLAEAGVELLFTGNRVSFEMLKEFWR